jgi:hypothetical protein
MDMAMPAMFHLAHSPPLLTSPALPTMSWSSTSTSYHCLYPPSPEKKMARVRQHAPRAAQGNAEDVVGAPTRVHWPRAAPTLDATPGPPLSALSFAAATPVRQTRSMARASTATADIVATFSAPVPPGTNVARTHQAAPHLTSKLPSLAWTPPTPPCRRLPLLLAGIAAPLLTPAAPSQHLAPYK